MLRTVTLALVAIVACTMLTSEPAPANDWPTYRGSADRGSATAERLPAELSLAWSYRAAPAPQPAWPSSPRMPFDRAHHVAVADGKLYFGSSADGKVYALDAATGVEQWTFYTDGPVRFAPAVWRDRVLAASDDGCLYALAAADGHLLWKKRGGPGEGRILGNDRVMGRWPARGGPLVVEDTVYFAAGIWPSEGIYLYALEAATGKEIWCNADSGSIYMPQPHGGANAASGVSAQGYLVADAERLFVPTGRAVPAVFSRADGKFGYFHLQKFGHQGGSSTMAAAGFFLNSGLVFDAAAGGSNQKLGGGALAALDGGVLQSTAARLAAYRWDDIETTDRRGKPVSYRGLRPDYTIDGVPGGNALLVAGDTAVVAGPKYLTAVDLKNKQTLWSHELDAQPLGLAAADGRLYVSTDDGAIHCFADVKTEPVEIMPRLDESPYEADPRFAAAAEEIVRRGGVKQGYCVDLGCGDGQLAFELAKRTELQIYAVDSDPKNVALARRKLDAAGLYGVRVTVHQAPPDATNYPNHFADLVVSGKAVMQGGAAVPNDERLRLQRPYGGVFCAGKPGAMTLDVRGPLEGVGTWTHQYADAANTCCSEDTLVRGPLRTRWFRDADFSVPQRHGRGPAPLAFEGRLFHEGMDGIRAVNAYNGRTLWEYPLPGILHAYNADHLMGTSGTGSNFCVGPEGVFVRRGGECLRLDAATGKLLGTFQLPREEGEEKKDEPGTWGYLASAGGVLFGSAADEDHVVSYTWRKANMNGLFTESKNLFALDAKTGELQWKYEAADSIRHNAIAIGGGKVYLIDRPQAASDLLRRRGQAPQEQPPGRLVALDARTGEELWKVEENIYGTLLALSVEHDALVMSYQPTRFKLPSEKGGRLACFRASDGRRLWDEPAKYSTRPLINDLTVYALGGAWDLVTGESRPFELKKSYGCGQLSGCSSMMFFRSATLGYYDLEASSKGVQSFGGIRPGCWINSIAAGGMLLVPDASSGCQCSYLNRAWIALEPAE